MKDLSPKKLILFLGLLLIGGACIDPFNIKLTGSQQLLVVDGLITDQPGPYTVKLSYTKQVNNVQQADEPNWVRGATVTIFDDNGTSEALIEVSPGNYQTTSIQGTTGRSYYITITTADGGSYVSAPDELLPVGDIAPLRWEFVENEAPQNIIPLLSAHGYQLNPVDISAPYGFNVYLDGNLAPEQAGLARWRWTGTFEILTFPQYRVKTVSKGPLTVIEPDPVPCSGYIVTPPPYYGDPIPSPADSITKIADCTCCNCWVSQYNETPLISDARFVAGDKVTNFQVAFIQANRRYMYDQYYLEVEQMSVTPAVYDFWKKVFAQQQGGSDLFQTPPAATTGNITATSAKAMPAIGVFSASAIKKASIILHRTDVPSDIKLQPIDTLRASCMTIYKNSSNIKPSFW